MNDMKNIISKRVKEVNDYLNVELNPDDPTLAEQITLQNKWDDPFALTKAMDMQPTYYARWATILRNIKVKREKIRAVYNVWESEKKNKIRRLIYLERKKNGLTDKQASQNITQAMVDDRFNIKYNYDNKIYCKYKLPLDKVEKEYDEVKIIVDAFAQRKDLLVAYGHLVGNMVKSGIMVMRDKHKKKR